MALDFLTAAEKALFVSDVHDLVTDAQVGGSITYQSFVSKGAFDATTGQVSETFAGTLVSALRFPLSEEEVAESGGRYQLGDYRYLIETAAVGIVKKDDRIIDNTKTRFIVSFAMDALSIFHAVIARNLAGE